MTLWIEKLSKFLVIFPLKLLICIHSEAISFTCYNQRHRKRVTSRLRPLPSRGTVSHWISGHQSFQLCRALLFDSHPLILPTLSASFRPSILLLWSQDSSAGLSGPIRPTVRSVDNSMGVVWEIVRNVDSQASLHWRFRISMTRSQAIWMLTWLRSPNLNVFVFQTLTHFDLSSSITHPKPVLVRFYITSKLLVHIYLQI